MPRAILKETIDISVPTLRSADPQTLKTYLNQIKKAYAQRKEVELTFHFAWGEQLGEEAQRDEQQRIAILISALQGMDRPPIVNFIFDSEVDDEAILTLKKIYGLSIKREEDKILLSQKASGLPVELKADNVFQRILNNYEGGSLFFRYGHCKPKPESQMPESGVPENQNVLQICFRMMEKNSWPVSHKIARWANLAILLTLAIPGLGVYLAILAKPAILAIAALTPVPVLVGICAAAFITAGIFGAAILSSRFFAIQAEPFFIRYASHGRVAKAMLEKAYPTQTAEEKPIQASDDYYKAYFTAYWNVLSPNPSTITPLFPLFCDGKKRVLLEQAAYEGTAARVLGEYGPLPINRPKDKPAPDV